MKTRTHWIGGLAVVVGVQLLAVRGLAEEDLSNLAKELIRLRGEVESLHDAFEADKRQHKDAMRSYAQRRLELESEVQRKELEIKKLRQATDRSREEKARASSQATALSPVVRSTINRLTQHVEGSLPFKRDDRLSELQGIGKKLEKGELSAPRAMNQLWTYVEDELRLARENGQFSQVIEIDGKEQLADVVRLGMVMLFFSTNDGRVGFAEKKGDAWQYTAIDGEDAKKVQALFDAFEKQVRTGYFVVPYAISGGVR
ncbi:MAG: DUF3450 family protein [Deltaproteobacteria bacterium]|jgi:hypothetical protein